MMPDTETETRLLKANNYNQGYALMDACKEIDALRAELAAANKQRDSFLDIADDYFAQLAKEDAELFTMHQQRNTLYSALQWIVSGMAGERQDIKDYANHILDLIDCKEETK